MQPRGPTRTFHVIYYDRRVPQELLDLICPDGPLVWLIEWLRSPAAATLGARLDFRREDSDRKRGGLQLYLGRTSPLEVLGRARGRVKLRADAVYEAISPKLFGTFEATVLHEMEQDLRAHIEACASQMASTLTEGEAVTHAGLMRRYGLHHQPEDPIVAIDSEVRVGFRAAEGLSGSVWRSRHEDDLRAAIGLPKRDSVPRKLDTIGLLSGGEVALVEVKAEGGDIIRAVYQAAAHTLTFEKLVEQNPGLFAEVLDGMVEQKAQAELLPATGLLQVKEPIEFIPVVAAPDARPDWAQIWSRDSKAVRQLIGPLLDDLRFWRLSTDGLLLEEFSP